MSNLPFDVVVYWINFEGKEEPAMVLPDGMTQYGGTYAGHVSHAGHLLAPVASPWLLAHAD